MTGEQGPSTAECVLHLLAWLDNLEKTLGNERLVDHAPNNFISRREIRSKALAEVASEDAYRRRRADEEASVRAYLAQATKEI